MKQIKKDRAMAEVDKAIKKLQGMIKKEQVNEKIEKSKASGMLENIYKNLQEIAKLKK